MADNKDKNKDLENKKEAPTTSVLLRLHEMPILASKVNDALDEDKSYDYIVNLCSQYNFVISKSAISRYKVKREESIETGIDLGALLDKRRKNETTATVSMIAPKEKKSSPEDKRYEETFSTVDKVYNDVMVLEEIIQKGMEGLQYTEIIEAPIAMKAIEIKAKITGNQLQGLSIIGLRELKLRSVAKETAITEILMQYIPEDKQGEVLTKMREVEKEFYKNLDLSDEDRRITEALKVAGINS
ncbi:hypothetical protein CKA15_182 [Listeria phage cka15]|nr:hypothetical protein CKA15_182 [Listeria phage cka15]